MGFDRRNFFIRSLGFGIASSAVIRTLDGLLGLGFRGSDGRALGQTVAGKKKYVFLYLDGGIRFFDFLDPQGERSKADAAARGLRLPGYAEFENDLNCGGFRQWEATGACGEYVTTGVAPVLRKSTGDGEVITLGGAAGPLSRWVDLMRLFRGVQTSIEHGTASQMTWCGKPFSGLPIPTIDCLLAGQVGFGTDYLLPHLIMGRSSYVPASIPQLVTQIPVPVKDSAADYERFFRSMFDAPFDYYQGQTSDKTIGALIDMFVDSEHASLREHAKVEANKAILDELNRIDQNRRSIYRSDALGKIGNGIASYLAKYSRTDFGAEIAGLQKNSWFGIRALIHQLGLVHHCLKENLSAVAVVNLGNSTFDCHSGYSASIGWGAYRQISFAVSAFLQSLADDGLMEDTTVVLMSEMGRDAFGGEHHHPSGTWAVIGGRIGSSKNQRRVFGCTTPDFGSQKVNEGTGAGDNNGLILEPKHLHALLLEDSGFGTGRVLESLLGIGSASSFMRKII